MSSGSDSSRKSFGIVVGGGPAPGINSVISSSVIEANNRGYVVKGLVNGFRDLTLGEPNAVIDLTSEMVGSIYNKGGSIIGTSRFNPLKDKELLEKLIVGLRQNNIDKLIVIGGEGCQDLPSLVPRHNDGTKGRFPRLRRWALSRGNLLSHP